MKNDFLRGYVLAVVTITSIVLLYIIDNTCNNIKQQPKQEVNQTYLQDSLCQVWVDSTHLRIAFKTWYNNNKGRVK